MKAVDLMTPEPQVVTPDESVVRVACIMREYDIGMVPVVDSRETMRPVGVITDRDLALRHVAECAYRGCTAGEIMSKAVLHSVDPNDGVSVVMALMRREKVRRLLVRARGGRLLGIISEADLLLREAESHPVDVAHTLASISEPAILHK